MRQKQIICPWATEDWHESRKGTNASYLNKHISVQISYCNPTRIQIYEDDWPGPCGYVIYSPLATPEGVVWVTQVETWKSKWKHQSNTHNFTAVSNSPKLWRVVNHYQPNTARKLPYILFIFVDYFLADVDECAVNKGGCNQICHNTVGSYYCSCSNGYQLSSDNHTCNGENLTLLLTLFQIVNLTV